METIINGRYRILKRLGSGGMAHVFLAEDMNLKREVALKQIRTDEIPPNQLENMIERFRREAHNLARLTDVPGVVTVLDYGIENETPFLVMNYLPGGTLKDNMGSPMEPRKAAELLLPIAEALSYVHSMGIVHRDIKPSNLLYDRFGRLALADFGIAKAFESSDATLTGTGLGVGTAAYMAPEQWRGEPTRQSDLYSLAIVYYEMITGRRPFEGKTNSDVFLKVMTAPLPDPRDYVTTISSKTCDFLVRATEKDPANRPPSMQAFINSLKAIISGNWEETAVDQVSSPKSADPDEAKTTIIPMAQTQMKMEKPTVVGLEEPTQIVSSQSVSVEQNATPLPKTKKVPWYLWGGIAVVLVTIIALVIWNNRPASPETVVATATDKEVALVEEEVSTEAPEEEPITEEVEAVATTETDTLSVDLIEENCGLEEVFCIGLVTDVSAIDDRSFNQSAWEGVLQAQENLGALVNYIESENSADYLANISLFVGKDYDVIVTVGFGMGEVTWDAASIYPDVDFIGIDQWVTDERDNLTNLLFNEWNAGFKAGALAGMLTETKLLAGVYGTDLVPAVVYFAEGFEDGAKYIDGDIEVITTYHPGGFATGFTDPNWGAAAASEAMAQGADVVFGAGGQTGNGAIIEVAESSDAYCIGVDSDQWYMLPEAQACLVSSAMKEIGEGTYNLVQLSFEGNFPGGLFYGATGLAPFHDFEGVLTPEEEELLSDIADDLLNGSIRYEDFH